MANRSQLVCQQLENVSSDVLATYGAIIKHYIRGRNGVYALYKGEKLYYVGLATNLRKRLKQHLRDRHKGLWDRFSVYLTIGDQHIKEMESLLLRIVKPPGNKQAGKFARCETLNKRLARDIKTQQHEELASILGTQRSIAARNADGNDQPVLAPYVDLIRGKRLRSRKGGVLATARVGSDGSITVRGVRGKKFNSPSMAGQHVLGRNVNGWDFWHYERAPGEWVSLAHLRE